MSKNLGAAFNDALAAEMFGMHPENASLIAKSTPKEWQQHPLHKLLEGAGATANAKSVVDQAGLLESIHYMARLHPAAALLPIKAADGATPKART